MRQLIEAGRVYIAMPPLYRVDIGKETHWAADDADKERILAKFARGNAKSEITRFKGFGEMMPKVLWESTLNPKTRRLLRVVISDAIATDRIINELMSKDASARFPVHHGPGGGCGGVGRVKPEHSASIGTAASLHAATGAATSTGLSSPTSLRSRAGAGLPQSRATNATLRDTFVSKSCYAASSQVDPTAGCSKETLTTDRPPSTGKTACGALAAEDLPPALTGLMFGRSACRMMRNAAPAGRLSSPNSD
jgi:hypothetical protein